MSTKPHCYIDKYITEFSAASAPFQVKVSELPKGSRILKPDSMRTMEFIADRLNLHIDDQGKVIKQTYG